MLLLIVFIAMEWVLAGTAALLKARGERRWYLALVPLYGFLLMRRVTGTFKVLTTPVKKYGVMMVELSVVLAAAYAAAMWGDAHLPEVSRVSLWQIMYLPFSVCILLMWAAQLKAAMKVYRMMRIERYALYTLGTALVLPAPFLMLACRNREIDYSISY